MRGFSMWLKIEGEGNPSVVTEVFVEDRIRQAVMQCCSGDFGDGRITLLRGETNWVESDGKTGIMFRQGGSGVFIYEGSVEIDVLTKVFLGFSHGDGKTEICILRRHVHHLRPF
jgi:hypothetical protein